MNGCYSSVYVAPVGSPSKPSFMVEEPSPEVQRLMQQAKDYQRQMQRNDGSAQVKKVVVRQGTMKFWDSFVSFDRTGWQHVTVGIDIFTIKSFS